MTKILSGLGLTGEYSAREDGWSDSMNENLRKADAISQIGISALVATLPTTSFNGNAVINTTTHEYCIWDAGWKCYTPKAGWTARDHTNGDAYYFNGASWSIASAGANFLNDLGDVDTTANGGADATRTGILYNTGTGNYEPGNITTDASNVGSGEGVFGQKNLTSGELEFKSLRGSGGIEMHSNGTEVFIVNDSGNPGQVSSGKPLTPQTIPANAWTTINYNTAVFDPEKSFDGPTGTYTAARKGVYYFNASVWIDSSLDPNDVTAGSFLVNGTRRYSPMYHTVSGGGLSGGDADCRSVTAILLDVGDTVVFQGRLFADDTGTIPTSVTINSVALSDGPFGNFSASYLGSDSEVPYFYGEVDINYEPAITGTQDDGFVLEFVNEIVDTLSNFTNTTALFTAPSAGVYRFAMGFRWEYDTIGGGFDASPNDLALNYKVTRTDTSVETYLGQASNDRGNVTAEAAWVPIDSTMMIELDAGETVQGLAHVATNVVGHAQDNQADSFMFGVKVADSLEVANYVHARDTRSSAVNSAATENFQADNEISDTKDQWDGSVFTAAQTGIHSFVMQIGLDSHDDQGNAVFIYALMNTSETKDIRQVGFGSDFSGSDTRTYTSHSTYYMKKGETIQWKSFIPDGATPNYRPDFGTTTIPSYFTASIVRAPDNFALICDANCSGTGTGTGSVDYVGFEVGSTSAQSMPNTGSTLIDWDTVTKDTESGFSTATDTYTIPTTGTWQFNAANLLDATTDGARIFHTLKVGGVEVKLGYGSSSSAFGGSVFSTSLDLTAGDLVTLEYGQRDSASRNLFSGIKFNWWSGFLIQGGGSGGGTTLIDYSTTEQLVGTNWIDAKPVYQITFSETTAGSNPGNKTVSHSLNIDTYISVEGFIENSFGQWDDFLGSNNGGQNESGIINGQANQFTIEHRAQDNRYDSRPVYITIRYTKN